MKQFIKAITIFILFLVFYSITPSCIKEEINLNNISDSVDWPLCYGAPVAHGNLSLKDLIDAVDTKGLIREGKDGLLYVFYKDTVFSQRPGDLLPIPQQQFSKTFSAASFGLPAGVLPDSVKYSDVTYFDFSINKSDARIDSMALKSGQLVVQTTMNFPPQSRITVTFPTLKKNGVPFKYTFKSSGNTQLNLSGYKLCFTTVGGASNKVPVQYDVMINKGTIDLTSAVSVNASIQNTGFSSIFGYLGQLNILNQINQKITLDLFDASQENMNIEFDQPKVTAYLQNSFGLPVRVQINNTKTYSEKTSTFFPVTFTPSQIDIKYPASNKVGTVANDTFKIQSNFFDAVKTSPHYFYYDVRADANPNGTNVVNFFTDTSRLNVEMELNLPLKFKAGNLAVTDTIDFEPGNVVKDFDVVKRIMLYNTFVNSIPFDLSIQVFLADENGNIVDHLYETADQPVIKSGVLNNTTGKYEFSSPKTLSISFDEQRAKKLENVKKAIVKIGMTTAGNGQNFVAFYSDYKLKVAFQMQTELKVTSLNQF